jgi:hypothetical protein
MGDGAVRVISPTVTNETLKLFIQRSDGQVLGNDR